MAKDSANGSGPSERVSRNGAAADEDDGGGNAFERFERLTRQIIAIPKAELDQRRERAKGKTPKATRSS